jgi:hypothetical protein
MIFKLQKTFNEKLLLEIIYPLVIIIIFITFAIGVIPNGFHSDDFLHLEVVQKRASLFENVLEKAHGYYYRPVVNFIWGLCYNLFGLWVPGYNIVALILVLITAVLFYKSVALLTNPTVSFITTIFLILHITISLLTHLAWFTTISALFFLWFTIYFIIRNSRQTKNIHLFLITFGVAAAILSKESTYIPLIIILLYYAIFENHGQKLYRYVYLLLSTFIVIMMLAGPSDIFRVHGGHKTSFILRNLTIHLDDMFYLGCPILVIPFFFSIVIFVQDRNIYKALAFYLPVSALLLIYGRQFPGYFDIRHIHLYLLPLMLCILFIICRRYLYMFFTTLVRNKTILWYLLFLCTFIPILSFQRSTRPYHYVPFTFLMTSLALTYFIWSDKLRSVLSYGSIGNKNKLKNIYSIKTFCIVIIISSLMLNSFKVLYHNLNLRTVYSRHAKLKYENHNAMFRYLGKVADQVIGNTESNSIRVATTNTPHEFTDNTLFLYTLMRHRYSDFKITFDPDVKVRDYSNNFKSKLDLLDLDPRIGFDPETEKYIIESAGKNLIIDNSFEFKKNNSFKYSTLSRSGNFAIVLRGKDYQEGVNIYAPDLVSLTLEPGFYLFGGYYKSENFQNKSLLEIADNHGNIWHSYPVPRTTGWKFLRGWLYLEKESKVTLRPLRINIPLNGAVYVDDLFLVKF